MNLHDQITALIQEYRKGEGSNHLKHAKTVIRGYNERRKAITAKMKPVLEKMQADFESGKKIGDCDSMKSYCAKYKQQGMLTYARCRQIITGTSGNETKVKSLDPVTPERIAGDGYIQYGELKGIVYAGDNYRLMTGKGWIEQNSFGTITLKFKPTKKWDRETGMVIDEQTHSGITKSPTPPVTTKVQQGKTHLVNVPATDKLNGITRCGKDTSKLRIAADGEAPTCKLCLQGTSYEQHPAATALEQTLAKTSECKTPAAGE